MTKIGLLLALKYGVPLLVKLLGNGQDESEAVVTVEEILTHMSLDTPVDLLLAADEDTTNAIIDGMFGVLTGTVDATLGFLGAMTDLLFGAKK